MAKLFKTTFKLRRGSSATWDKNNPVLEYGEPGFDKDQYIFKIGDGKKSWRDLKPIGATVQSDWNQNDETAPDFVKNRIAWEGYEERIVFPESELTMGADKSHIFDYDLNLIEGETYIVKWGEEEYECKCEYFELDDGVTALGLGNLIFDDSSNDLPFVIYILYYEEVFFQSVISDALTVDAPGEGSKDYQIKVSITGKEKVIHQLNSKFYERLGWEETEKQLIFREILEFSDGVSFIETQGNILEAGEQYDLTFCGQKWETNAFYMQIEDQPAVLIGSTIFINGEYSEESFLPFLIVAMEQGIGIMALDPSLLPKGEFLEGSHALEICSSNSTIKKIDKKFLPILQKDYKENNYLKESYIKNRPFYDGSIYGNGAQIIRDGALSYQDNESSYVKINDFLPFSEEMTNSFYQINGIKLEVNKRMNVKIYEEGWELYDYDNCYFVGIEDVDAFNYNHNFRYTAIAAPGIYVICPKSQEAAVDFSFTVFKKIDGGKVDWNDLLNRPFGRMEEKTIRITNPEKGLSVTLREKDGDSELKFSRFSALKILAEDLIGATLRMANGKHETVRENMIEKSLSGDSWLIDGLLFGTSFTLSGHEDEFEKYKTDSIFYQGTYTIWDGENYVESISFPTRIKKINLEFLPDSLLQTETDPTVPEWAKQPTKPTYTANEVGALPHTTKIPVALADLTSDKTHRLVTDEEKEAWGAKSDFSGSYDDLVNKPKIPSIEGLASEEYVNDKFDSLEQDGRIAKTKQTQFVVDSSGERFNLTGGGDYFIKFSDEAMDLSNIVRIDVTNPSTGNIFSVAGEKLIYKKGDNGIQGAGSTMIDYIISGQINEFYGTFVLYTVHSFYSEKIIAPIKLKYLPDILPKVTESDAGKFLRVSAQGAWTAEIILNAEEVAF